MINKHGVEWMPLHDAAYKGNAGEVERLLKEGAEIDCKGGASKGTSLHLAVWMRHQQVVKLLLAKGADVNAKDQDGRTPLDDAVSRGPTDIIELLRQNGGVETPKPEPTLTDLLAATGQKGVLWIANALVLAALIVIYRACSSH